MSNDSNTQSQKNKALWQCYLEEKDEHARQLQKRLNDTTVNARNARFEKECKNIENTIDENEETIKKIETSLIEMSRHFERRSEAVAMMDRLPSNEDNLKNRYSQNYLAGEKEKFVIVRIIGNDLYPRHRKGQSRDNLRFILENEQPLEDCSRYWLVNRIVDAEEEKKILSLLEEFKEHWIRIPFEVDAYRQIEFDMTCLPNPGYLASSDFMSLDKEKQQRVMTAMYRHKNNYIMNNNGARNRALEEGRLLAKWVLPWDGNCFLTPKAWQRIREDVVEKPWLNYFLVPMTRVQDNAHLIDDNFQPDAVEEPQVLFRKDSVERFDETFCYGRRPKVEFFWRLGVPGKWNNWRDEPWDRPRSSPGPFAGQYGLAGWVARLSSGMLDLEKHEKHSVQERFRARQSAIIETLQLMDRKAMGYKISSETVVLDLEKLSKQRASYQKDNTLGKKCKIDTLLEDADSIFKTLQKKSAASQDENDFFNHSMTLMLAWFFSEKMCYAKLAARIFRRFFFGRTETTDDMAESDETVEIELSRILPFHFMHNAWCFTDVVVLLAKAGVISQIEFEIFKNSAIRYLDWLHGSKPGKKACSLRNEMGTCVDLQASAIAAFVGDGVQLQQTLLRALCRFNVQTASDGSFPILLGDRASRHRCCRNLQAWVNLSIVACQAGLDLRAYRSTEGATLDKSVSWFLSFNAEQWPYSQMESFNEERLEPLKAFRSFTDEKDCARQNLQDVFPESNGIRAYWHLGE